MFSLLSAFPRIRLRNGRFLVNSPVTQLISSSSWGSSKVNGFLYGVLFSSRGFLESYPMSNTLDFFGRNYLRRGSCLAGSAEVRYYLVTSFGHGEEQFGEANAVGGEDHAPRPEFNSGEKFGIKRTLQYPQITSFQRPSPVLLVLIRGPLTWI